MNFELYENTGAFNKDVYGLLMENEAANMMFLGDLAVGISEEKADGWRDTSKWVMAAVKDKGRAVAAALIIPGDNLQLYVSEDFNRGNPVFELLAKGLGNAGVFVKGVHAKADLAEGFAGAYASYTKFSYKKKSECLYTLNSISPDISPIGSLRLAREEDMAFIPYWWEAFFESLVSDDFEGYKRMISAKNLYILEDKGIPVSMGRIDQRLENICGLGLIYTPPYFRNRGYGSSVTAHLSKLCLGQGYTCALIADLANSISNRIYQKIGYKPVCDMLEIKFEKQI